jgi:hypothetical protein
MRTIFASLAFVMFATVGLGACALDGADADPAPAEAPAAASIVEGAAAAPDVDAPVTPQSTCLSTQRYCPDEDICIPRTWVCGEMHCRTGFHSCGDYCEKNGHYCM